MHRRIVILVGILAALGGAAAHVFYWYAPRERPGAPASGDPTAAVFAGGGLPLRVWIPYPHQNLAALRRQSPQGLATVVRLIGLRSTRLPRFGPFELPPSVAVALAADAKGERFFAVAAVYPSIRWVARAAGRLAGNPWLAGGSVESGGRRLRVGWLDGLWWVTSDPNLEVAELLRGPQPTAPGFLPSLVCFHSDRRLGPLPAGDYRVSGPVSAPKLLLRSARGEETTVLDLGGDGSRLEIRLPATSLR